MMDYTVRYGLSFDPFLKNAKEILVNTDELNEAKFRLDHLAKVRGFGILTGASGRGKTTVVRNWVRGLNPSLFKSVYTSLSTVTLQDFYRDLAFRLGAQPAYRKPENFRAIQDEINRLALEKKKTPVIIIDEANSISNAILNDLKILFNFEMDSRDRAVILLTGLEQLNTTLRLSIHEPLRQRIVMNYNLGGVSKEEGRTYINEKLKGAGSQHPVFEEAAIESILNAADGVPRMINRYCTAAMMVANSSELPLVTADAVMKAVSDSELA